MKNAMLKERVEFFKETEEGAKEMKGIEEIIAERSKAEGNLFQEIKPEGGARIREGRQCHPFR